VAQAQARLIDLATRVADRNSSLIHLRERRQALSAERVDHQSAVVDLERRAGEQRSLIEAVEGEQASLESERDALEAEATELGAAAAQAQARKAELQAKLADIQRDFERLQSRQDLLSRLREEGEAFMRAFEQCYWR